VTTNYGQQVYSQGTGTASTTLLDAIRLPRNPNSGDNTYPLGKEWVNTTSDAIYQLASYEGTSGNLIANWVLLSSGISIAGIETINTIPPALNGNFTVESVSGTITITPELNGISLDLVGGGATYEGNTGGLVSPNVSNTLFVVGNNSTGINVIGNSPINTLTIVGLQSSTTQEGTVTLATNAQAIAGTDTFNAVTSAALAAKLGTQTAHSLALFEGSTSALSPLGVATNGQLPIGSTGANPVLATLTAGSGVTITNGAGSIEISATGSGGTITTIDGDTGSITGTTVTIYADNAAQNCGSSVLFVNSGTTSKLNVTDANTNTMIGFGAGNSALTFTNNTALGNGVLGSLTSGSYNTSMGSSSGSSLQTGSNNTSIGFESLFALVSGGNNVAVGYNSLFTTSGGNNTGVGTFALVDVGSGSHNIGLGSGAGGNYTSSESNNIVIGNAGVAAESNVIRIGTQGSGTGQQSSCYIAGIEGVSVSNLNYVTINTATGQLGSVSSIASSITITGDSGGGLTGNSFTFTGGTSGLTFAGAGTTETLGGTLNVGHGGTGNTTFTAYSVICAGTTATGTFQNVSGVGTAGQVLTSNGASALPTWQDGGSVLAITSVAHGASPYTVLSTDQFLACQTSGGVITIKLPNAPTTGRVIYIKDSNGAAATSNISVTTVGGTVTIDGQTTYTMATNYQSINVIFDGTNYEVF